MSGVMEPANWTSRLADRFKAAVYAARGRQPGTKGFSAYSRIATPKLVRNPRTAELFYPSQPLPVGFGQGLSERAVEYPWLLARLARVGHHVLDAGSSLNHGYLVEHPVLSRRTLTCVTLAPEPTSHYDRGVSYLFADLRDLPLRDEYYDAIACVSTLEHIGMDNAAYLSAGRAECASGTFMDAALELWRVLKPGGTLFVTVPFGRYENLGWLQQFDLDLLRKLEHSLCATVSEESFFRYDRSGWVYVDAAECTEVRYQPFKWAGAVACVSLVKPP